MNRDYSYCVGVNYFEEKNPELCKNCNRHIPWSTPVEDSLTWVAPQYDEKTCKCPLHEPKSLHNEQS